MYQLKLGTATDQIILLGDTVTAPWRGGVLKKTTEGSATAFDIGLVTDTYYLTLEDTPANIATALTHLQAILNQAINYNQHHTGKPVYLYCTLINGDPVYTSPVKNGFYDPVSGSTGREAGSVGVALSLDRWDFWEGPSAMLPLTNRSANRSTTGIAVVNHQDSDTNHDNFVEIAGSDVAGDLPAAVNLDFTNSSFATYYLDSLIMALNSYSNPGSFSPVFEGSGTADATCSAGSKLTVASVTTTDAQVATWNITPPQPAYAAGNDFMVLLRLGSVVPAAGVLIHASLWNIGSKIFDLPAVLIPASTGLVELGVLTIPPGIDPLAGAGSATLGLKLYAKTTSGSRSLEIDFVYLAAMDGYRRLNRVGRLLQYDECIVDDGFTGTCYLETNSSAYIAPNYNTLGSQFKLVPGLTQRIAFFQCGGNAAEIDRPGLVHVHYKPRKRHL